ncbi:MAG: HisA/HisF-related TIM barrel protein, partial [Bacteroidales bacterium]
MIELIPAIDIIDGKCVRLTQGDYAQKTIYSSKPDEIAKMF